MAETVVLLVIAVAVLAIVWTQSRKPKGATVPVAQARSPQAKTKSKTKAPALGAAFDGPRLRSAKAEAGQRASLNVVGESHYQDVLWDLCGGKSEDGQNAPALAVLRPVDDNPHDPLAVQVEIDGRLVGHLDRTSARIYRGELERLGLGLVAAGAPARIVGGWADDDGHGHFGVKLSASAPLAVAG